MVSTLPHLTPSDDDDKKMEEEERHQHQQQQHQQQQHQQQQQHEQQQMRDPQKPAASTATSIAMTDGDCIFVMQKLENENHQLRARLEQAEHTVAEMAHQMELQKTSCRQLIAGWKLKLQEGEEKLTAHSSEKDTQLSNLLSQLMYFEGNLKRERAGIEEEMNRKNARIQELDKTVKHQQKQIDALNRANERLLTSLHQTLEVNNHHSPDDDSESEETSSDSSHDSCPSSSGTPTTFNPIPLVARSRKVSMPALMSNGMPPPSMMNHHRRHRPSRPVSVLQQKQRQNLVANGGLSSPASSSPDAPRRRVRFGPDVETSTKDEEVAEDTDSDNEMKKRGRLRKISLPAYRLPTDEEGSIRYF